MNKLFLPVILLITFGSSLFAMQQPLIDKETEQAIIQMLTEQNKILDMLEEQLKELSEKHATLEKEVDRIEALRDSVSRNPSLSLPTK